LNSGMYAFIWGFPGQYVNQPKSVRT
jgi:hypothetical protein